VRGASVADVDDNLSGERVGRQARVEVLWDGDDNDVAGGDRLCLVPGKRPRFGNELPENGDRRRVNIHGGKKLFRWIEQLTIKL
jgi:hypothetical protein